MIVKQGKQQSKYFLHTFVECVEHCFDCRNFADREAGIFYVDDDNNWGPETMILSLTCERGKPSYLSNKWFEMSKDTVILDQCTYIVAELVCNKSNAGEWREIDIDE